MRRIWFAFCISVVAAGVAVRLTTRSRPMYFESQTVTVEGEVLQFDYRNPHAWVHLTAKDENGEMQRFSAEWASPNRLKQQGLHGRVDQAGRPGRHHRKPGPEPRRSPPPSEIHRASCRWLEVASRPREPVRG